MKFNNFNIELPKFTIGLAEKMEEIQSISKDLLTGNTSRRTILEKKFEFLTELFTEEKALQFLSGSCFEDIDIKNLELLYLSIKNEYERPIKEAEVKEHVDELNLMFKNGNIKDIVDIMKIQKGK